METNQEPQRNTSELALKLQVHLDITGTKQTQVAKAIGCTPGVISSYLSGTYKGDVAGTEEKIRQYLELEEERAQRTVLPTIPVVKITAWARVTNAIKVAASNKALVSVTGPAGTGKTRAIKEYVATHASTILVLAHQGYTSRDLFGELCDILSLSTKGTLHAQLKRIVEKIDGSGRPIIVDQAEYLPKLSLDMLRSVRDFADVPIVLVGLPRLNEIIQGDQNNFAQMSSRMLLRTKVDNLTDGDVTLLIHAYLGDVSRDVAAALHKYAHRNARILVEGLIYWCLNLSRLNKAPVAPEFVVKAAELIGAV